MPRLLPYALVSLSLMASRANAEPSALALPKTALEPAFAARIVAGAGKAGARVEFASCPSEPCALRAGGPSFEIEPRFEASRAELQRFETPSGKRVVWIRLPERGGTHAFEIVLAPGHDAPLFAAITSNTADASATTERVLRRDVAGKTLLLTSTTPPGGGLCGLPTAPGPVRAWDGIKWSAAALSRLDAADRQRAITLVAKPSPEVQAARYLVPAGGSDESFGKAAVDGDARTAWLETRSGDGTGEYASYRLDKSLAVTALSVRLAPTVLPPGYAAPRAFYILTDSAVYRVSAPLDTDTLRLELPAPVHSACLSVVLDEANEKVPAPRSVGIAELSVHAALDAEAPAALAARLADPARADEALATLLGVRADLGPLWKKIVPGLSPERRARVEAAMAERGCGEATSIAVLGLGDTDRSVREHAERKLEQCRRESVPALLLTLDDSSAARAGEAGRLLALLAPSAAQKELPPRLGHEATRASFWPALGKAFRSADVAGLRAALAAAGAHPAAQLDVVLALGDRIVEVADDARAVLHAAVGAAELGTRFRAVDPAVRLADAFALRVLAADPEPAVRHRVLLGMTQRPRSAGFDASARSALGDSNPRVRAAAADYFRAHPESVGGAAAQLFPAAGDPWPFVRMASLRAIAGAAPAAKREALETIRERLGDPSFDVRKAALEAMAGLPAATVREDILGRLDDEREAVPVRAQAARSLGAVCSVTDLDRLTLLAHATLTPMAFELEREVGLAALEALGALHPRDLAKRLEPLRSKKAPATLKAAADRALAAPARCPLK